MNITVAKGEQKNYIVNYVSDTIQNQVEHTVDSFLESVYAIGRLIHINDIHFEVPRELAGKVTSFLRVEYPGEIYEHKITVS